MKTVAVVLSGCGVFDGSEIHESVLTLLAIKKAKTECKFYAPSTNQTKVVNHLNSNDSKGTRSVMEESARIARGEISPLSELDLDDADCVIFPGGFGAALNLCSFAIDGPDCNIDPEVERVISEFHANGKPQGFICIAPVLAAKVLGSKGVSLTIGTCQDTAGAIESLGARHEIKKVDEITVDATNKVVSTPAYMLAESIEEAEAGINKLVSTLLEL